MRQTELFGRIRSYAAMVVMVVAMLSAGCESDDEVPSGEYYVGPDQEGWYTFTENYSVYEGVVSSLEGEYLRIDTESSLHWKVYCLNIGKSDYSYGDTLNFEVLKFTDAEPVIQKRSWISQNIFAYIKLLNVKKP